MLLILCTANVYALTLDEVINEAVKNNYLIRQRAEIVYSSLGQKDIAKSYLLPKLSFTYTYQRFKERPYALFENPFVPENRYKVHIGDRNRFYWNITITQPLFTGFELITRYKIAKLGVDLRKFYRDQIVLDIIKEAKISYFQVLLSKKYLEISKEEVEQLRANFKDAEEFFRQGMIPYNDLLKSKVALSHAEQNLVRAKSSLKIAISKLNTIIERDIDENTRIQDISSFKLGSYRLNLLYEKALKKRPEIRALKIAIDQARQKIRLAKSGYYPHIYLFAKYEQMGNEIDATGNDYGNTHNTSIGFEVRWDIFEWGKTKAQVRKAVHEYKALCYELKKLEDKIRLEVKSAFERLNVARKNITTAKTALIQAKENYRITNLRYQQNLATSTEVLDARTLLTQAEVNYYNALYGYMIAKAELERAVGER